MGRLSRVSDSHAFPLSAETVIGRSRTADLRIDEEFVSGLHAAIVWSGSSWSVRDLGSRNGTFVNGRALAPGSALQISEEDEVAFGRASAAWRVSDDRGPRALARGPAGEIAVGADGIVAIPGADDPSATVIRGADGLWRIEISDDVRRVEDRDTISIDGEPWIVRLPTGVTSTSGALAYTLTRAELEVDVPTGRPATAVRVVQGSLSTSFELGSTAAVFTELARARARDPEGWVDREALLESLVISGNHLNVVVFRLRRQFADTGFSDAAQIVERGRGRLRLGTPQIVVREATDPG